MTHLVNRGLTPCGTLDGCASFLLKAIDVFCCDCFELENTGLGHGGLAGRLVPVPVLVLVPSLGR
jgi:hypothetical protein